MSQAIIGRVSTEHKLTNTTDRWLVVADYREVLSNHATQAEAEAALPNGPEMDELADTPWGVVNVVRPGATIGGKMSQPIMGESVEIDPADETFGGFFDPSRG